MVSRRRVLAVATGGLVGGAIFFDPFRFGVDPTEFSRGSFATTEPVFDDGADRLEGAQYAADVFGDPDSAREALATEVVRRNGHEHVLDFDRDEAFLGILASTVNFNPGGTKGWCPMWEIRDGTVDFHVPLDGQPPELEPPYVNDVVPIVWRRNFGDVPTDATVTVQSIPDESDVRTC